MVNEPVSASQASVKQDDADAVLHGARSRKYRVDIVRRLDQPGRGVLRQLPMNGSG